MGSRSARLLGTALILALTSCKPPPELGPDPTPEGPRHWTIGVYVAGDNNLESYALRSLNQMESVPDTSNLNAIALLDRAIGYSNASGDWKDTRLYEVTYDRADSPDIVSTRLSSAELGLSASSENKLDLGAADTLRAFVIYLKNAFPADHYAVILWGHGTGWRSLLDTRGVGYSGTYDDRLDIAEIRSALTDQGVELIGFDTTFGATIEHAYELSGIPALLVASEDGTEARGWDYTRLLTHFQASHADAQAAATSIVESYRETYEESAGATLSVIDLSAVSGVFAALNAFSTVVHDALDTKAKRDAYREEIFSSRVAEFYVTPGDLFKDLYGVAVRTKALGYASAEADALAQTVETAVAAVWQQESPAEPESGAHGLSLYYVSLAGNGVATGTFNQAYVRNQNVANPLRFVADSAWVPETTSGSGLLYRLWLEAME